MTPLTNYIPQPVKTAALYTIDNPISTAIIISAEKSLDLINSATNLIKNYPIPVVAYTISAASFGIVTYLTFTPEIPKALEFTINEGKEGFEATTGFFYLFLASAAFGTMGGIAHEIHKRSRNPNSIFNSDYISNLKEKDQAQTQDWLRRWMQYNWEQWERPKYEGAHPLMHLDAHPHEWELAIRAANEIEKGDEFRKLVESYREQVGTRYLRDASIVKETLKDPDLEAIILGDAQIA